MVTLGGKQYALAFPLHACALYQKETAKLDRARSREKGALTAAEICTVKEQRRQVLRQADAMREQLAALSEDEDPKANAIAEKEFYELLGEAVLLKSRLDEDAGRGDSLFLEANSFKINSDDQERVVLALWAGLHQPEESADEAKWLAPFTVHQLHKLVDPANAEEIIEAISKALRVYSVKKKQRQMENPQTGPAQ